MSFVEHSFETCSQKIRNAAEIDTICTDINEIVPSLVIFLKVDYSRRWYFFVVLFCCCFGIHVTLRSMQLVCVLLGRKSRNPD